MAFFVSRRIGPAFLKRCAVCAAALSFSLALTAADVSDPVRIAVEPENHYLWHTATGSVMRLEWDMPPTAGYADLTVEGAGYSDETNGITTGFVDVTLPAPKDARTENVYRFTLTFSDGSSMSASLGLVCGHAAVPGGAMAPVRCRMTAEGPVWTTAPKRYVIPVPSGTEELSVGDAVVDTGLDGAAGWYAAGPFPTGARTQLALSGALDATAETLSHGIGHFIILR